jgi:hypothetical protein
VSNAERLLTAFAPVFSGTEATVDEGVLDRLEFHLDRRAAEHSAKGD